MKTKNSRNLATHLPRWAGRHGRRSFPPAHGGPSPNRRLPPQRLLVIHRPCGSAMNPKDQPGAPSWWWPTSGAAGGTDWVVAPGGLIDSFKACATTWSS